MLAKSRCVIAGLDIASEAFRQMDPAVAVTVHHGDGNAVRARDGSGRISWDMRREC